MPFVIIAQRSHVCVAVERRRDLRRTSRTTPSHRDSRLPLQRISPSHRLSRWIGAFAAAMLLFVAPARAQLTIEIVGGAGTAIPIAVLPFENDAAAPAG